MMPPLLDLRSPNIKVHIRGIEFVAGLGGFLVRIRTRRNRFVWISGATSMPKVWNLMEIWIEGPPGFIIQGDLLLEGGPRASQYKAISYCEGPAGFILQGISYFEGPGLRNTRGFVI